MKKKIDRSRIIESVWQFGCCGGEEFARELHFKEDGSIRTDSLIGEKYWNIEEDKIHLSDEDGKILSFTLSGDEVSGFILYANHWANKSMRLYLLETPKFIFQKYENLRINYLKKELKIKSVKKSINLQGTLSHLHSCHLLEEKDPFLCQKPHKSFADQSFEDLDKSLSKEGLSKNGIYYSSNKLRVHMCTIKNGYFFVGNGLDGAIFTEDFHPVEYTTLFNKHPGLGVNENTPVDIDVLSELDEAFIGFDFFWGNYFHFLNFSLAKSYMAKIFLGDNIPIVFPDCDKQNEHWSAYSNKVRDQAFEFSGLNKNLRLLPKGAYKVKKLHFLMIDPSHAWAIMFSDGLTSLYNAMARHARRSDSIGKKVYIARGKNVNARTSGIANSAIAEAAGSHNFVQTSFENMDLQQQISISKYAEQFISPHGAGLTNILFNPGCLKVLEINKKLDGVENGYRPCFYMASAARGHDYYMLDSDTLDKSPWQANSALQAMKML
ncbi:glycosyltransferase family 61 protein [Acetobacter malorum]|nr:glycosyltransferase family 61 protein [Acetobacter malorum]